MSPQFTNQRKMAKILNQKTVCPLRLYAVGLLLLPGSVAHSADFAPPPVMLANIYRADTKLADYWVSEKLDGVRGYWDGEKLLTRGGERISAPGWFTAGLPKIPMDGELWVGRGKFEETVSILLQQTADHAAWRKIRFMVFDLPP